MSASSPSLKHPVVIVGLVLGAVAVAVLNIQTFGPGQRPTHRVQAAAQNMPALPPDLALLVQAAVSGQSSSNGEQQKRRLPQLERDPFRVDTGIAPPPDPQAPAAAAPVKPRGLVCSAVMTGGKRPSAMINGKFYSPGDRVEGWTLAWIATNGVTLQNSKGAKKFVPLTNKARQSGALTVKLGQKPSTTEQGQEMPERNLP